MPFGLALDILSWHSIESCLARSWGIYFCGAPGWVPEAPGGSWYAVVCFLMGFQNLGSSPLGSIGPAHPSPTCLRTDVGGIDKKCCFENILQRPEVKLLTI